MLAVVKKPHIEIRAKHIPAPLLHALHELYKPENVIVKEDDELVRWEDTDLAKEIQERTSTGEAIFLDRDMRGMTQAQLAKKLGVAVTVVSDMENNRRAVSRKMAVKLADVFGSDPAAYFRFK